MGVAYENDRQTLRVHIANLRRKLASTGGMSLIDTHHGAGYRFTDRRAEGSSKARRLVSGTHPLALDGAPLGFRRPEQVDHTIPAARLELTDQGIAEIEGGARWIRPGSWDSGPIGGRIAGR